MLPESFDPASLLLQGGGVSAWNQWRGQQPTHRPILRGVRLPQRNLVRADFRGVDLSGANLIEADLRFSDLDGALLVGADLNGANLRGASLTRCDLTDADISAAHFSQSDITRGTLCRADARRTRFEQTRLAHADLTGLQLGLSTLVGVTGLNQARGLDQCRHTGPSALDFETLRQAEGQLPAAFLAGCGLHDWEIVLARLYASTLTADQVTDIGYEAHQARLGHPIHVRPLFVSYSRGDAAFVDALEPLLRGEGIRFWRDSHDLRAGRIEAQIDQILALDPVVLLVLSEDALNSDWVQHEAGKARAAAKRLGRDVLCPIALDNAWQAAPTSWPARLVEQIREYHILDFSEWRDEAALTARFRLLLDGLRLFYRPGEDASPRHRGKASKSDP